MFKNKYFLSIVLLIISFCLRVYKIDSVPLGTHPDEASWGYNAYSILETGKDEYGVSYPLIFQAFGDQKLPGYTYLLVPFIKLFGMNNLAVRLPSAIIGSLLSLLIFFLLIEFAFTLGFSFIGGLITATSPWTIILSRTFGYDSNLGLLFFTLGILFFFKYIKNKQKTSLFISILALGMTCYSYIAYRLITPLIVLSLVVIFVKTKKLLNRDRMIFLIGFLLTIFPLIILSFSSNGTARFSQVISTPNLGMVLEIDENRAICTQKLPKILCYLNANKLKLYSQTVLFRYIKTFSPNYLFLEGDKDSKFINVDYYGLFNFLLLPFYFIAIIYFSNRFLKRTLNKTEIFVLMGLLITPLSALLVNEPQKIRLSALFLFQIIFLVYGISQGYFYLKNFLAQKVYLGLITVVVFISTFLFMIDFLVIHLNKYDIAYQNENNKLVEYLGQQDQGTEIYIKPMDEAIILYSYINKINPQIFQTSAIRRNLDNMGFSFVTDLDNIHVTSDNIYEIYCKRDRKKDSLYATNDDLMNSGKISEVKKIIYSGNGAYALKFIYDLQDIIDKENIDCEELLLR